MSSPPTFEVQAYRLADACTILSVSRSTLWKLNRDGLLRLVRIGRRTLVPRDEIERLLAPGSLHCTVVTEETR